MLNFTKNNELLFSENTGNSILLFGLKQCLASELEYFEVQSLGGTSATNFEAVCIDISGIEKQRTALNPALIFFSNGVFYSDVSEPLELFADSIYYYQITDNLGNQYFSEPFNTYLMSAPFVEVRNAFAGGSLNFQTVKPFYIDNSILIFGLKQFSAFEMPFLRVHNFEADVEVLNFRINCVDILGNVKQTIELNVDLIQVSTMFFTISKSIYSELLQFDSIYYFEIETANEHYFSEYFNTVSSQQNNLVVTMDCDISIFFDIFTTADSTELTWDCSQI